MFLQPYFQGRRVHLYIVCHSCKGSCTRNSWADSFSCYGLLDRDFSVYSSWILFWCCIDRRPIEFFPIITWRKIDRMWGFSSPSFLSFFSLPLYAEVMFILKATFDANHFLLVFWVTIYAWCCRHWKSAFFLLCIFIVNNNASSKKFRPKLTKFTLFFYSFCNLH